MSVGDEIAGTQAGTSCRRLGLIVPEFRVDGSRAGGLDTVAQFILDAFTESHGWTVQVVSPRMSRQAAESQRILCPQSWFSVRHRITNVDGLSVAYFGSMLAEIEFFRYLPRRNLSLFLDQFDVVMVVAGSPAIINVASKTSRPVIAQVATFVLEERAALLARRGGVNMKRSFRAFMSRLVARLEVRGLQRADLVLVENEHMLDVCRKRGIGAELVPPGVDCELFRPRVGALGEGYILGVGRWADPRKDLPTLLRAFEYAVRNYAIQQRLVLAGLSAPNVSDQELIGELGLGHLVDVVENAPQEDLAELYRGADVFALASTEEGLGLVFLEAMASGTPVVTTSTMGAQYALANSGAGELVPFGPDLDARFGAVLAQWCMDAPKRQAAAILARSNVLDRFDSRDAGGRFRDAVATCLSGSKHN